MTTVTWDPLPCGVDPCDLLAYAADGTAPPVASHEAGCPYCRAAITEFGDLWGPVRQWAGREVVLPDRFVATVMARVRRLVQSPRHVADMTARGTTTVTSWVLGLIATKATRETPGVGKVSGTPSDADLPSALRYGADGVDIAEVGASDIAVRLGFTAQPVPDLFDLAEAVRRNIIQTVTEQTQIRAVEVDITVDDIDVG